MKYKITTAPTVEPVTVAEAKLHCRILGSDEDSVLSGFISAAREYAEAYHCKAYATKTITAVADSLVSAYSLPVQPVSSITSITIKDSSSSKIDITSKFELDEFTGEIILKPSEDLPSIGLYHINPVEIVYKAGAEPSKKTKQAMLLLIGHWFENREEVVVGQQSFSVPMAAEALLQQERHSYL
jgi:uncharacterized phiE125 gp8 family phage protein